MIRAGGLAVCLWIAAAQASADEAPSLDPAFDNTIVTTYPDGRMGRLWLNRDGSYVAQSHGEAASSGRWTVRGARICMRQRRPFPAPFSYCTEIPHAVVGASWTTRAVSGEMVRIQVVAGR